MKSGELEERMRALECFHSIRVPAGAFAIVRVDGRSFSKLTEARFEKPFDPRFHGLMVDAARALLEDLGAAYAYTESDEISLAFDPAWNLFDRELEKIVSLSAAIASASFARAAGLPAAFDGRVCVAVNEEQVVDYFRWRQADAGRAALNGWCYWTERHAGTGVAEATRLLEGRDVAAKNELLMRRGINFNALPAWQRRGTGLYWEAYRKEGYDPKRRQEVLADRSRVRVDGDLPIGDEYERFVKTLLAGARR